MNIPRPAARYDVNISMHVVVEVGFVFGEGRMCNLFTAHILLQRYIALTAGDSRLR